MTSTPSRRPPSPSSDELAARHAGAVAAAAARLGIGEIDQAATMQSRVRAARRAGRPARWRRPAARPAAAPTACRPWRRSACGRAAPSRAGARRAGRPGPRDARARLANVSTLTACLVFCAGALVICAERDADNGEQACKAAAGRMRSRMCRGLRSLPRLRLCWRRRSHIRAHVKRHPFPQDERSRQRDRGGRSARQPARARCGRGARHCRSARHRASTR